MIKASKNESRIGEIDLDNPDYFLASPNVSSFAENHKWFEKLFAKSLPE
jgi:dipeptidase